MKIFSTLLTLLTLLLITSPVFSSIEVNGTVNYHNEDKTPLIGVKVLLKDLNGSIVAEEISGEDGEYSFQNVNPGDYILTAESDLSFDVFGIGGMTGGLPRKPPTSNICKKEDV